MRAAKIGLNAGQRAIFTLQNQCAVSHSECDLSLCTNGFVRQGILVAIQNGGFLAVLSFPCALGSGISTYLSCQSRLGVFLSRADEDTGQHAQDHHRRQKQTKQSF